MKGKKKVAFFQGFVHWFTCEQQFFQQLYRTIISKYVQHIEYAI